MSDLESLCLQAIADTPHDWQPRLIFADWLEEQGDPRWELIRLAFELTRLACEDRARKEARLQELRQAGIIWPTPELPNGLGMRFVLIPPGEFLMGSPLDEPEHIMDEGQVEVTLTKGFWLGQYQVTQAEYEKLIGTNPSRFNSAKIKGDASRHPVEEVKGKQAMEFCRKLTEQEREAGNLPEGWEYTLPTEAQWEYACRAGTTTATAFGNSLSSTQANFNGAFPYNGAQNGPYQQQTVAVGSYEPNAWNLYDMHGNVWEWCQDGYHFKLPGGTDPMARAQASQRAFRGGGWSDFGRNCRSANRSGCLPIYRTDYRGFRVAVVQIG